jgi:hypothetical protein
MANVSATLIKPAEPASTAANRLDRLSDWISPMVIKEVRQLMRGREFNYSFLFSVFVGLIVAFVATINNTGRVDYGIGIFIWLMVCLSIVGVVVSPLGAFNALRNERMERTLDLVTITTMSPRRIVIGKLAAQAVKLIVLFAALAPFVAMSFLLGGIDFVTIAVSLMSLFMWSLWVCAAALFLSCLSKSRAVSTFIFIGMILFFLFMLFSGSGLVGFLMMRFMMPGSGMGYPSPGFIGSFSISSPDLWLVFAWVASFCVISGTNIVLLAENRLLLPTEDRSTSLRLGFLLQYLFVIALFIYLFFSITGGPSASEAAHILGVFGGLHLFAIALFSVTEELDLSRRVMHQIRTASRWRRLWILRPGGSGGAVYVLALMILLLAAGAIILHHTTSDDFSYLAIICGYVCFFTGVPTLLVRRWPSRRIKTVQLRIGIVLLLLVAVILPDFLMYLATGYYGGNYSARHVLNPFRTLYQWHDIKYFHLLTYGLCLSGLISYLILIPFGWRRKSHDTAN